MMSLIRLHAAALLLILWAPVAALGVDEEVLAPTFCVTLAFALIISIEEKTHR